MKIKNNYTFYSCLRGCFISVKAYTASQAVYLIRQKLLNAIGCFDNDLEEGNVKCVNQ